MKNCKALAVKASENIRRVSASGGAMVLLANVFYQQGGCVYGAAFDDNFMVHHIRTTNLDEIKKIQGSKYVLSDIRGAYKEIENDLSNGKKVLFSGTPCQIAAVKNYINLKKIDLTDLLCVDIICHGIGRQDIWRDYIKDLEKKYGKLREYTFRNKEVSWTGYPIKFVTEKENIQNTDKQRFYIELYNKSLNYVEACYKCKYANLNRVSDITIGDLWQSKVMVPKLHDKFGVSLVILNTEKGKQYMELVSGEYYKEEIDLAKVRQTNLMHATPRPLGKDQFDNLYNRFGYKRVRRIYLWKWRLSKIKHQLNKKGG